MALLDNTLANLAPGVSHCRDLPGRYNPKRGLAIYCLPIPGYSPSAPGVVLGEALAARSGLGCTLLEGVPAKIPEGAVVVGQCNALKAVRPDLLEDVPELREQGQYAIRLERSALVTSPSREGLAGAMQTLAMIILRHNEDTLPGSLILDTPACQHRCLAVEVATGEISGNLLMQMASFAATFKANRLQIILDGAFDPAGEFAGLDTFVQACQSYGIVVGVGLPWLASMASGERSLDQAWDGVRTAARIFGAGQAGLDDPCPADIDPGVARRIVESMMRGDSGIRGMSADVRLLQKSGCPPAELRDSGVVGFHRLWEQGDPPPLELGDYPMRLDVQSPVPGFSNRPAAGFHRRLDVATGWLRSRPRRELVVSFRDIGVSHMWQNLLFPAAAGLVAAWGIPRDAARGARIFSNLLYGDYGASVESMWDSVSAAFPSGLTPADERLIRRTAFGRWPDDGRTREILAGIDWMEVTRNIRAAAESLKNVAAGLSRNASTLSGAKLSLQALSWLHCFAALEPELSKRRKGRYDEDGRTGPIAEELYNNFQVWQASLRELFSESGLEISELGQVEEMGARLKELCGGHLG